MRTKSEAFTDIVGLFTFSHNYCVFIQHLFTFHRTSTSPQIEKKNIDLCAQGLQSFRLEVRQPLYTQGAVLEG